MVRLIPQNQLEQAAPLLRVAAHPVRLRIIDFLRKRPATVSEIAAVTACGQAPTSQHLAVMRSHGILSCEREGRHVRYALERVELLGLLDCIRAHCRLGAR